MIDLHSIRDRVVVDSRCSWSIIFFGDSRPGWWFDIGRLILKLVSLFGSFVCLFVCLFVCSFVRLFVVGSTIVENKCICFDD